MGAVFLIGLNLPPYCNSARAFRIADFGTIAALAVAIGGDIASVIDSGAMRLASGEVIAVIGLGGTARSKLDDQEGKGNEDDEEVLHGLELWLALPVDGRSDSALGLVVGMVFGRLQTAYQLTI